MSKSKTLILKEKTKIRSTNSADSTCVTKKARTIWKRSKKRSTTWMMPPSKLKRALVMNSNFSLESVLLQLMKKVQLPTCRNCKKRSKMSLTRNKTNWKTWKVKWKLSKHSYMPNLAAPLSWKKMLEVICRNFKLKTNNLLNYFQKFAWILFILRIRFSLSIACFSIIFATAFLISSALMPPLGLICLWTSCPLNYWIFSSI